jgi:hypothetical protein
VLYQELLNPADPIDHIFSPSKRGLVVSKLAAERQALKCRVPPFFVH